MLNQPSQSYELSSHADLKVLLILLNHANDYTIIN